jgi:hypothetical protein
MCLPKHTIMVGVYFLKTVGNCSGVLIDLFYFQLKVLHLQSEKLFLCLKRQQRNIDNFHCQ